MGRENRSVFDQLVQFGKDFLLFANFIFVIVPDMIPLQTEDCHTDGKNCPEVFRQIAGKMRKRVKRTEITKMRKSATRALAASHLSQNHDDR